MSVLPYKNKETSKREQVEEMFDNISPKYDLLNHLLSAGVDVYWRRKAISMLKGRPGATILDVATGTGDFALEALKLKPAAIIGVDISEGMLKVGEEKIRKAGHQDIISFQKASSESLPFPDNYFDAVIVSFGVRNFDDLEKGLKEMNRVMKEDGTCLVMEFSKPRSFPFKQLYYFYFKRILPLIGRLISKDTSAYTYLPDSVQAFPDGKAFLNILERSGFKNTKCTKLTFGICSIYTGHK